MISRFLPAPAAAVLPGLFTCVLIAVASWGITEWIGGPILVYALLLGMLAHAPLRTRMPARGVDFAANDILKFGVALLGVRISFEQILSFGATPLLLVAIAIPATILMGLACARVLGLRGEAGLLSGGAVAICGASAAVAIAAVLPKHKGADRELVFTVIGVTTFSTIAMLAYPLLAELFNLDAVSAGIFLGGSIHNVPQAIGAGYAVSDPAGDAATFIKLLRVAMLAPVVLLLSMAVRRNGDTPDQGAGLPWFIVAFVIVVAINSFGLFPTDLRDGMEWLSRACLVVALAAIGLKASLGELAAVGWRPLLLMLAETVFLAALLLIGLSLLP